MPSSFHREESLRLCYDWLRTGPGDEALSFSRKGIVETTSNGWEKYPGRLFYFISLQRTRSSGASSLKYSHHLILEMTADFHGDASGFGIEGAVATLSFRACLSFSEFGT